ncbi:MAG: NADPH-dependent F420 reductase [Alphaproteobacteria bacterium]|nr:NADPH-dependent F420 reductase [Alphaproteobacteria bacterium]
MGGAGAEGSGLAVRWAKAGYRVLIGSRAAERAAAKAAELNALIDATRLEGLDNRAAAERAAIVVLTVPYAAQLATLQELKPALAGKILVDVTVPLVPPRVARVQLPRNGEGAGSAVEIAQQQLGPEVRVVSAFQNVSAHHLMDLDHAVDCDVLVTGDDKDAREIVVGLVAALGMRGLHAGSLANSAAAEALTSVLVFMNRHYKSPGAGIRITGLPGDPS